MKLKFIPIAFLGAALVACGGGGGGGGSSSTAVTPTLQVTAKVDGVVVAGYPTTAASAPAITLHSGQELEISSSAQVAIVPTLNGVVAAERAKTATTYRAVLAATVDTNASVLFTTPTAPPLSTTVPVIVKAAAFAAVVPKPGDSFLYSESVVQLNGTATTLPNTRRRVDTVRADGSWAETNLNESNTELAKVELNKDGNRISSIATASNPQTCNDRTPADRDSRFIDAEKLLEFPLTVGKKFTGSWTATCGTIDRETQTISAEVIGYESITTAAGVFNALRIRETTTVSGSTNSAFLGAGYSQQVDVWFDPVLGRNIRFSGVRTYGSPNVSQALVQKTTIDLLSYVKN